MSKVIIKHGGRIAEAKRIRTMERVLTDFGFDPVDVETEMRVTGETSVIFEGGAVERLMGILTACRKDVLRPSRRRSVHFDDHKHYAIESFTSFRRLLEDMQERCSREEFESIQALDDPEMRVLGFVSHEMERIWSIGLAALRQDAYAMREDKERGWTMGTAHGRKSLAAQIRKNRRVDYILRACPLGSV